jgi:hypothetical protein
MMNRSMRRTAIRTRGRASHATITRGHTRTRTKNNPDDFDGLDYLVPVPSNAEMEGDPADDTEEGD